MANQHEHLKRLLESLVDCARRAEALEETIDQRTRSYILGLIGSAHDELRFVLGRATGRRG